MERAAMTEATDNRATVEAAIRRTQPNVEAVKFDDDREHVWLLTPYPEVGEVWTRYKLGPTTQRFLLDGHPTAPEDGLTLELLPTQDPA
jgi:hypothetical protein